VTIKLSPEFAIDNIKGGMVRLYSFLSPMNIHRNWFCLIFAGFFILFSAGFSQAYERLGFGPSHYPAEHLQGQGIYFAPYQTTIYETPDENTKPLEVIQWADDNTSMTVFSGKEQAPVQAAQVFIAFYPEMQVAMLPVIGENGEGWAEVIYDQGTQASGWVQLQTADTKAKPTHTHFGRYQTWMEFMRLNARKNGIYWLSGVSSYHKAPRTSPKDTAKLLHLTVIKGLRVRHVRGNWMLVEVRDMGGQPPMGWVRWRDDDGKLMVFTNFQNKEQVVIPAGY
jgi:hypothetical protein